MILGREKEIVKLNEYYDSDESSFVAIYGRRRVGKTFLINHVFEDKLFFKHTGIFEGSVKEQITAFYNSLIEYGYKESNKPTKLV